MIKRILAIFTLFTLSCQAFNTPLCEEESKKLLWYRCLYLEASVYNLTDLKEECDDCGWNERTSQKLDDIIDSMKWSLGFPE